MEQRESKDVTQKNLEGYPDVTADILNVFLHGGRQNVQASALYPAPTETEYAAPGSTLRIQLEDISKYEMRNGRIQVQYLLANQTTVDYKMILRKTGYEGAVYREQYEGKVQDEFPVVSLLLYWGEGHWGRKRSIRTLFENRNLSPQVLKLTDDCRLHVFEMRNLTPEVRRLFRSDMRHVADYLAEGIGFRSDYPVVHKEALVRLLRALGGDINVEDTAQILNEMNVKEEDNITMCELFEQYIRRGRQEGLSQGLSQGRKEGLTQGRREGLNQGRQEGLRKGRQEGLSQERQEGLNQGRQEGLFDGLQKGLQALISTCHDLGVSFDETAARVKEKFSLCEEDTQENMRLYW